MKASEYLSRKTYPGRVLICGSSSDGNPIFVYAVMGRSKKSRNRILKLNGERLSTELYIDNGEGDDLIIYSAKGRVGNKAIVGNGEHVGYIEKALSEGNPLERIVLGIDPEPDSPNYTPRIAFAYDLDLKSYQMMISRRVGSDVERVIWSYGKMDGYCHIMHTYEDDSNPLVPFLSNPVLVEAGSDIKSFAKEVWCALDKDNRIALYYSDGNIEGVFNQREMENAKA